MSAPDQDLIADLGLGGLDPVHREAVSLWFAGEFLKRTLVRLDPDFDSYRPRDLLRLMDREDGKAEATPSVRQESGQAGKGGSAAMDAEMRQLKDELGDGPLRWIVDPASDSAAFDSEAPPVPTLFLSYSHADKRFADRLGEDLRQRGYTVWQDDRDMRVGDSLAESVRRAIDDADYVLSVVSASSIDSVWVRRELDIALEAELKGRLKKVLPVRRGDVDLPSALAGKLYADFPPGRYGPGLRRLLETLDWDLDQMPVMVSTIVRSKAIEGVVDFLAGRGWSRQDRWSPLPVRAEITAGYLSHMRGRRGPAGAKPATFPPHSPVSVIAELPVLTGKGTQIAFSQSRVDYLETDLRETRDAIIQFPAWKYMVCIAGPSKYVHATTLLLSMCPDLDDGGVDDLEDALKWWADPEIPAGPSIEVAATPIRAAITIEADV